jgi:DHA1 family tetracycline resistance protein-like MFS transporter
MKREASLVFILLTLALDALGFGIVVPIVPSLVKSLTGGDTSHAAEWVGALVATFAGAQFIAAPVLGGLSDRFGRRPVVILSLLGSTANYALLAWAPSLAWLFLGRLLAGATAASASAANAYIADITPPALRSARFGLVGAMFGAGFVLGPAMGGVLGAIDLRLPFMVAGGLSLANALYGALVLPESLPPERRRAFSWSRANPVGSLRSLAADKVTGRLALGWGLMWFGLGALQSAFVLSTGLRFGWGPQENGWALAAVGVSQAVVQGALVRPIIRRLGERSAAFAGFGCAVASYCCFGFAQAGWVIYLAIVLQGFGAIAGPAMRGMMSTRAAADRQGELQGGLSSVEGLTAIVSPVAAAVVFALAVRAGGAAWSGAPFLLGACTYAAAAVALLRSRVVEPA